MLILFTLATVFLIERAAQTFLLSKMEGIRFLNLVFIALFLIIFFLKLFSIFTLFQGFIAIPLCQPFCDDIFIDLLIVFTVLLFLLQT